MTVTDMPWVAERAIIPTEVVGCEMKSKVTGRLILSMAIAAFAGQQVWSQEVCCPPLQHSLGQPQQMQRSELMLNEGEQYSADGFSGQAAADSASVNAGASNQRSSSRASSSASSTLSLLSMGFSQGDSFTKNTAPAGAGLGSATAANQVNRLDITTVAISPGLLTSVSVESPYAIDRAFFSYSYYGNFKALVVTDIIVPAPNAFADEPGIITERVNGFDLNRFDVGFEKRLGENVSFFFRAPYLDAANNITGADVDGFGNLSAGIKTVLLYNRHNGNALTTGLTVSAPTARDTRVLVNAQSVEDINNPGNFIVERQFQSFNPTYLQPWLAARLNYEDFFAQAYSGLVISTSERSVSAYNGDLTVGANLYHNAHATLSSVTTFLSTQVLTPFDGGDATLLDFDTQVFLSPGIEFGLGRCASLGTSLPIPVAGPRAFDLGFSVNMNYFF